MADSPVVQKLASKVKLLLMDCDGVLTDGRVWILESGDDQKAFHVRDGLGIELLHRAGLRSGIISGRNSTAVERRARGLGMSFIRQGFVNKIEAFEETLIEAGVSSEHVAYIGDDLNDIPLMVHSGLGVAVADGVPETRVVANYVTKACGGRGAVREVVELILKSQGLWDKTVSEFLGVDTKDSGQLRQNE
ncbi:MAG TPA: HAD hydrolase family protein [Pyrinomonadaceae bacterium]|nr:HAD hydrolase family protein [Pyrinomonadaceae bacterium]